MLTIFIIFFLQNLCLLFSFNINSQLPIINISLLLNDQILPELQQEKLQIIHQIGEYCREIGFFYISGHGVEESLQQVTYFSLFFSLFSIFFILSFIIGN